MRLFAICINCHNKFYVSSRVKIRSQLPQLFYLTCPICHQTLKYTPQNVFAEPSDINTAGGALVGS